MYPLAESYSKLEKPSLGNELLKIKYEIIDIYNLIDHEEDQSLFIKSLSGKFHDYSLEPPKIKIKSLPEIGTDHYFIKNIIDSPVSSTPRLPSNQLTYPRNEVLLKEEDEMEKLKKLIKSKRFVIVY